MYTPHNSVAFHPYHRKSKPPMFWENSNQHKGEGRKSARRVQELIRMRGTAGTAGAVGGAGAYATHEYDATESAWYGLGSERHADDFYRVFGVDRDAKKITKDLCRWSTSGKMHRQLTAHMRPDKKGIDYDSAIAALGYDVQ